MTPKNTIKYFIYARKSSEDEKKQVASIPDQIEVLTKLARENKLDVIEVFAEIQSAKEPGRPIFNEMIQRIYKKEAQGVICWKLDRLARNPVDGGTINWMLQQGAIQHIQTHERGYFPSDNVLMMSVEFGMANQYVIDLSANVKRGLRNKVSAGQFPGVAKPGYLNTPDLQKGFKVVIEDPIRHPLVRRMWDLMLTGNYTPPRILKIATNEWNYRTVERFKEGGRPMSRSQIYKIFTDTYYYGQYEYPVGSGNWYKTEHKPMITEEEYQRVQSILGKRGKPAPKKHLFAFTGLMKCGSCQSSITAETKTKHQKNGNVHNYVYYHCTKKKNPDCLERSIEVKELEQQIDEVLGNITISETFKDWAIKYLHEVRKEEAVTQQIAFQNQQSELAKVSEQIRALLLEYIAPRNKDKKLISEAEYEVAKTGLQLQKDSLERDLQGQGKRLEQWVELSERTFNFAHYARMWFQNGDKDTQRAILACLGSNLIVNDGKVNIELRPTFKTIFENTSHVGVSIARARTSQNVAIKGKTPAFADVHPSWLRG